MWNRRTNKQRDQVNLSQYFVFIKQDYLFQHKSKYRQFLSCKLKRETLLRLFHWWETFSDLCSLVKFVEWRSAGGLVGKSDWRILCLIFSLIQRLWTEIERHTSLRFFLSRLRTFPIQIGLNLKFSGRARLIYCQFSKLFIFSMHWLAD